MKTFIALGGAAQNSNSSLSVNSACTPITQYFTRKRTKDSFEKQGKNVDRTGLIYMKIT